MNKDIFDQSIFKLQEEFNIILPDVFVGFLSKNDGYSDGDINIFNIEDLLEAYDYMEISEYASGYVAIGNDGGGRVYLMKQEPASKEVIISTGCLDISEDNQIIIDFEHWCMNDFIVFEEQNPELEYAYELVDIILKKEPGIKALASIKSALKLNYTSQELFKMSKSVPCVLSENIHRFKAAKMIKNTGFEELFELKTVDKIKQSVLEFQEDNNIILPDVYVQFLLNENGRSLESGILIYSIEALSEMRHLNGYVKIGEDGSGRAFLMKQETGAKEVFILSDISECMQKINDFEEWSRNDFFDPNLK